MVPDIWWLSPAKLNLMLRITGRRADGYHQLQTVFQFIDRADRLRFRPNRQLECSGLNIAPKKNLILRAAHLLQQQAGIQQGIHIEVNKRLPMGGGLGGGSSNAATTLLVLNQLWQLHYSLAELAELGLQLGADVPIFIHGRAAWAEGIGEKMHFFEPLEPWYVVVKPNCEVSTAKIFQHPDLTRNQTAIKIRDFQAGLGGNICQPLVTQLYPEVERALLALAQYGKAQLTGTGACIFAPFASQAEAQQAQQKLVDQGLLAWVSRGYNTSPLHQQLKEFIGAWPSG